MDQTPETLRPYNDDEQKHLQVEKMFDAIAPHYDFMNRLMSFRQDIRWRRTSLKRLKDLNPAIILDVATGTGDFAIDACKYLTPKEVVGIDLSEEMMQVGREKIKALGLEKTIRFEQQDCLALTFQDKTFDALISAFGVRNFENILQGLTEMARVLKPGGQLLLLELSRPTWFPANVLFKVFTNWLMPLAGKLFTKDGKAYEYLPASIQLVPQGKTMLELLNQAGFTDTRCTTFTFGACSLYTGTKR